MSIVHKIKYMEITYFIFKNQKLIKMKTFNVLKNNLVIYQVSKYIYNYHIQTKLQLSKEKLDIFH